LSIQLRRFNKAGVERFRAFIATLKTDKKSPPPFDLLTDTAMTELVAPRINCADAVFDSRLSAAEYLYNLLLPVGLANALNNDELWSWLSLRFYDELMPIKKAGIPAKDLSQLGVDESRFIPSNHFQDRHRHLLRHPLQIYHAANGNAHDALCFLVQPVYKPGDVVEQFGSRQLYSRNKEMLATMSALIVDPSTMKIRRNASSKARRLDSVLQQFDCTWDLGFIAKDLLVPMLPKEFTDLRKSKVASKKWTLLADPLWLCVHCFLMPLCKSPRIDQPIGEFFAGKNRAARNGKTWLQNSPENQGNSNLGRSRH
jgi:hypothetical protein